MIDHAGRLHAQLTAAGVPVEGVSLGRKNDLSTLAVQYATEATAQQRAAGEVLRSGYAPTPTEGEQLDGLALPSRVQAAVVLRLSASWATATVGQKARVQAVLDQAGARVLALLS